MRTHALSLAAALAALAQRPFPIEVVQVEGVKEYTAAAVIAASGLKPGQTGEPKVFDAARDRLLATGLFDSVGYRYAAGPSGKGYAVTFEVNELGQLLPFQLDRLPVSTADAKAHLRKSLPLYSDRIPATQQVLDRYRAAVQELVKGADEVRVKVQSDKPGELYISFQSASSPPVVAEVHFKGNKVLTEKALQAAVAGAAVGSQYSEERFREVLSLGLKPLYDARGRVRMRITGFEVAAASGGVKGLAVTAGIDEGESYSLGTVTVEGSAESAAVVKAADLKSGEVMNFDQVKLGQERIHILFRRNGYMKVASSISQKINDKEKTVDVTYQVEPGPQFLFGKLHVKGLDLHGEHEIRRLWTLQTGKLFNADYPQLFLNRIREEGIFDSLGDTKADFALDEGARVADVILTFKAEVKKPVKDPKDQ